MKNLLLTGVLLLFALVQTTAQNVSIPDLSFKACLLNNSSINTNGDSEIQVSEAAAFTGPMTCANQNIADLTGIEAFTALTVLYCHDNLLTTLDVSNNTSLVELFCFENDLTSLTVAGATQLEKLAAFSNDLTFIDVSQNPALEEFRVQNNFLEYIDVAHNANLTMMTAYNNLLTGLDMANGSNTAISGNSFTVTGNPNLTCIHVDDAVYSNTNWTNIDLGQVFAEECGFITTWKTDNAGTSNNNQITMPTVNSSNSYHVNWGDGTSTYHNSGSTTHTYPSAGTYTVKVTGDFPDIYFNNGGDRDKILSIENWGDNPWQGMGRSFYGCSNLTINATDVPDLSSVTTTTYMFRNAGVMNSANLANWDVSNVVNFKGMFWNAPSFNQDIGSWDMSSATDMAQMFRAASAFNQDLSGWDVSGVDDMNTSFFGADNFNGDVSTWDVGSVLDMASMFNSADVFNQDLSNWDVSSVQDMGSMFSNCNAFNQDLSSWDVSNVTAMGSMLHNTSLSINNYDNLLNAWALLPVQPGLTLGATGLNYCNGATGRTALMTTHGWTINDAGLNCLFPFVTTWKTDNPGGSNNDQITITTSGVGYNYNVDWGDGTTDSNLSGDVMHTYSSAGTYTVSITGDFPRIHFYNSADPDKLLSIEAWGDIEWTSMEEAFYNCENMVINATDAPDLSGVTSTSFMFMDCDAFNQDISHWDVSTITDMSDMFERTATFNQPLDAWDVSNVQNMEAMFLDALAFNQDLNNWDVSSVNFMNETFARAPAFNGNIADWDVSAVLDMSSMFYQSAQFNSNLSAWNTANVEDLSSMFFESTAFDQDLGNWPINFVLDAYNMLDNSGMSIANYDNLLIGWAAQSVQNNVNFGAEGLMYCSSDSVRSALINTYGWIITDAGQDPACVTGIEEQTNEWLLGVHPNPASNWLTITTAGKVQEIKVLDLTGQTILQEKGNTKRLNVEALPSGIYLLTITTSQVQQTVRFIKQ